MTCDRERRRPNTLPGVHILVTEAGSRLLEARRSRLDPDVLDLDREIFVVGDDHQVRDAAGITVGAGEAARPDVAWMTADTFARAGASATWVRLLAGAPNLRWLQSPAAGYLSFYDPLLARGVRVTSAHVNAIPIAEYVLRAVLEHSNARTSGSRPRPSGRGDRTQFRELHARRGSSSVSARSAARSRRVRPRSAPT